MKDDPVITFHSTKVVQAGPNTFVKIADRVEITVDLTGKRVGVPLVFKQ